MHCAETLQGDCFKSVSVNILQKVQHSCYFQPTFNNNNKKNEAVAGDLKATDKEFIIKSPWKSETRKQMICL